jgi:hypothetical protein
MRREKNGHPPAQLLVELARIVATVKLKIDAGARSTRRS